MQFDDNCVIMMFSFRIRTDQKFYTVSINKISKRMYVYYLLKYTYLDKL